MQRRPALRSRWTKQIEEARNKLNMPAFDNSVSIIIPTRNEAENISPLVSQIVARPVAVQEILFVDDSTDGTRDVIRSLAASHPLRLVEQDSGRPGLAGAVMSGAEAARGTFLLIMDADLSHPPAQIDALLAPLLAGEADIVIGSRYVPGGLTPGWPLWRRLLSRAGSALAYPLTGVHDSMSNFFAIRRSRLLEVAPPHNSGRIAFEVITRAQATLRVLEIPIVFQDRERGRSKMSLGIAFQCLYWWLAAILRRVLGSVPRNSRG
jgi:dolichol-phosphate mannosyltransferase